MNIAPITEETESKKFPSRGASGFDFCPQKRLRGRRTRERVAFTFTGRREYSYTLFVVPCGSPLAGPRERVTRLHENGHLKATAVRRWSALRTYCTGNSIHKGSRRTPPRERDMIKSQARRTNRYFGPRSP